MTSEAQKYLARFPDALSEAHAHARAVFPEESCGFIVRGRYLPLQNVAKDPAQHVEGDRDCTCRLCAFEISDQDYLYHADELQAIVHSHPNGPDYPSKLDMLGQESSGVAWIIVTLDETRFGPTVVWGGDCPIEPLIGREFLHGINDCYALVRDAYALGHEGMAAQGMDWPLKPITLPIGPRNNEWWLDTTDNNLYSDNYVRVGFVEIPASQAQPGDAFLGRIRSDKINHAGVLLGNNLILHHLPMRLSRREPAGVWSRCADKWVRYVGAEHA
jgi:proteasome lid subunit RPN8/RPN11